jgi:hypothetical protein
MNRHGRPAHVVFVLICVLAAAALRTMAQELAPPPLPVEPYKNNDKGLIVAQVTFAADGKVAACRIVRSNAPYSLEASTFDYIKREWNNAALAGQTIDFPIMFDALPSYVTHWNDGLAPPPSVLPIGDPGRTLKLELTFDADGWLKDVHVVQSSGVALVDRETAIWAKAHWHNSAFAGQKLIAPVKFEARPAPKAPVVQAPPPPKPEPTPPAQPAELPAPPAVRVQ